MPGASIGTMNAVMPGVLGDVGVGAGDGDAPGGEVRARRPDLLPVDHPLVAVADRPRREPGEVGAGARLGEELAAELVGAQERPHEAVLLLLGVP